jgi:ElaB/YqjD/DUF883 family membrane-anchored ribosome-binding protein
MPNTATPCRDHASDEPSTLGEKLSDTAAQVKHKVSDLGRTAASNIDENRDAAASGLQKAASVLHENAEKVSTIAHTAADKLTSTADYVREHNVNGMMADVGRLVKNNPGPSLLTAAAIGFLVGRAFRGNRD